MLKKYIKKNINFLSIFAIFLLLTILLLLVEHYDFNFETLIGIEMDLHGKLSIVIIVLVSFYYFFVLNFLQNSNMEKLFLVFAIPIGIIYMIAFPIGSVPDEKEHFFRAYEISLGYITSDKNENGVRRKRITTRSIRCVHKRY